MTRALTVAQTQRLEKLAVQDPEAVIVGWRDGPVVRNSAGRFHRVTHHGRLTALQGWDRS